MAVRNHRSHLRANDGSIWGYLVLPQKLPTPPIPAGTNGHMARAPFRGDLKSLLPGTVAFLKSMLEVVNFGHERRGEPKEEWFRFGEYLLKR